MGKKTHGPYLIHAIETNNHQKVFDILLHEIRSKEKRKEVCVSDLKRMGTTDHVDCPLMCAAVLPDPSIIQFMCGKLGVNVNFVYEDHAKKRTKRKTALIMAVRHGLYDTVEALLALNADQNCVDHKGRSALHHSVRRADYRMTKMLLTRGAQANLSDRHDNTPLHIATIFGHVEMTKVLLQYGGDLYKKGQHGAIPIHMASREGHAALVRLFCQHEVNPNIRVPCYDEREKAPLHVAAEHGHVETIVVLAEFHSADVNVNDSEGETPLHCAVLNEYDPLGMKSKEDFTDVVKVLLKLGADFNKQNGRGETPLHLAARNEFHKVVDMLVQVGCDPLLEDNDNNKAIDLVSDSDIVTKNAIKTAMTDRERILSNALEMQARGYTTSMDTGPLRSQSTLAMTSIGTSQHLGRTVSTPGLFVAQSLSNNYVQEDGYLQPLGSRLRLTNGRPPPTGNSRQLTASVSEATEYAEIDMHHVSTKLSRSQENLLKHSLESSSDSSTHKPPLAKPSNKRLTDAARGEQNRRSADSSPVRQSAVSEISSFWDVTPRSSVSTFRDDPKRFSQGSYYESIPEHPDQNPAYANLPPQMHGKRPLQFLPAPSSMPEGATLHTRSVSETSDNDTLLDSSFDTMSTVSQSTQRSFKPPMLKALPKLPAKPQSTLSPTQARKAEESKPKVKNWLNQQADMLKEKDQHSQPLAHSTPPSPKRRGDGGPSLEAVQETPTDSDESELRTRNPMLPPRFRSNSMDSLDSVKRRPPKPPIKPPKPVVDKSQAINDMVQEGGKEQKLRLEVGEPKEDGQTVIRIIPLNEDGEEEEGVAKPRRSSEGSSGTSSSQGSPQHQAMQQQQQYLKQQQQLMQQLQNQQEMQQQQQQQQIQQQLAMMQQQQQNILMQQQQQHLQPQYQQLSQQQQIQVQQQQQIQQQQLQQQSQRLMQQQQLLQQQQQQQRLAWQMRHQQLQQQQQLLQQQHQQQKQQQQQQQQQQPSPQQQQQQQQQEQQQQPKQKQPTQQQQQQELMDVLQQRRQQQQQQQEEPPVQPVQQQQQVPPQQTSQSPQTKRALLPPKQQRTINNNIIHEDTNTPQWEKQAAKTTQQQSNFLQDHYEDDDDDSDDFDSTFDTLSSDAEGSLILNADESLEYQQPQRQRQQQQSARRPVVHAAQRSLPQADPAPPLQTFQPSPSSAPTSPLIDEDPFFDPADEQMAKEYQFHKSLSGLSSASPEDIERTVNRKMTERSLSNVSNASANTVIYRGDDPVHVRSAQPASDRNPALVSDGVPVYSNVNKPKAKKALPQEPSVDDTAVNPVPVPSKSMAIEDDTEPLPPKKKSPKQKKTKKGKKKHDNKSDTDVSPVHQAQKPAPVVQPVPSPVVKQSPVHQAYLPPPPPDPVNAYEEIPDKYLTKRDSNGSMKKVTIGAEHIIPVTPRKPKDHDHRYITYQPSGKMPFSIVGGNVDGIFVHRLMNGSDAQKRGLVNGDEILKVNGQNMKGKTKEDVHLLLASLKQDIGLLVRNRTDKYNALVDNGGTGDAFFVRSHFSHGASQAGELAINEGDIFSVRDTLPEAKSGMWRALKVNARPKEEQHGLIPNKRRAEQIAMAIRLEQPSAAASRGGFLRRSFGRSKSMDRLNRERRPSSSSTDVVAYERVEQRAPEFKRPVVLLGLFCDVVRDMIVEDAPDLFDFPMQEIESPPRDDGDDSGEPVNTRVVRSITNQDKHCLMIISPRGIDYLRKTDLNPIVIYLTPSNKVIAKSISSRLAPGFKMKPSHMVDEANTFQKRHGPLFTAVIPYRTDDGWFSMLKDTVHGIQNENQWVRAQERDYGDDDDDGSPTHVVTRGRQSRAQGPRASHTTDDIPDSVQSMLARHTGMPPTQNANTGGTGPKQIAVKYDGYFLTDTNKAQDPRARMDSAHNQSNYSGDISLDSESLPRTPKSILKTRSPQHNQSFDYNTNTQTNNGQAIMPVNQNQNRYRQGVAVLPPRAQPPQFRPVGTIQNKETPL